MVIETNQSFYALWQVLLTKGPARAKNHCDQNTFAKLPSYIISLVAAIEHPDRLILILSETSDKEKTNQGWEVLFFGLAWLSLGSMEKGVKLLEKAADTVACRAPALVTLARIHLDRNQREMADKMIMEGISLDKNIGQFHLQKARLLLSDKAYDNALIQVETARKKGNFYPLDLVRTQLEILVGQDRQTDAIKAAVTLLQEGIEGVKKEDVTGLGLKILISCSALDEADNFLNQALEQDRNNVPLLTHRAEIAALTGRYRVTNVAVTRALHQDENNINLLAKKARLAGKAFSHDQGLKALGRIMELTQDYPRPDRAIYKALYGDIFFDQDQLDKSITAYKAALTMDENCIPALAGLTQVLITHGLLDDARVLQDRMYKIAPLQAVQMMINNDRMPDSEAEITRLASMAENPGTPLPMRASLSLSLAKVYQKQGDHSKAMAHAHRANKKFCTLVSFDHKREARVSDQIIARMSKTFFNSRKNLGSPCDLPLFICGMPRSGTTLVEQILGGHSKIFPGGELGQIPRMWGRLNNWEHRLGSGLDQIPHSAVELTQSQSIAFAEKVEKEYRDLMPKDALKKHITDKLPQNFKNIGLIKLLYPKAKIIYCRREPGGIALSNYFTNYKALHGGMGYAYDMEWIGWEIANCQRLMAHWIDIFGKEIHVVDYEALVESPEPVVKKMFDYLELDWEEWVLDFHTLDRPVKTASVTQVRQPLYKGSKNRWRCYENHLKPMFDALVKRNTKKKPDPLALPIHNPGLFLEGMDLLTAGKNTLAESRFRQILDHTPGHAAAMHMLGTAFFHQGFITPAQKCMERSIRLHPGNPTWYDNLAVLLDHASQPEAAEKYRYQGKKIARQTQYIPEVPGK